MLSSNKKTISLHYKILNIEDKGLLNCNTKAEQEV